MIHLLRKYDVAHFIRNDAMFANSLGEADIIHEVNIISDSDIICRRQTSLKKVLFERTGLFSVIRVRKRTGRKPRIFLTFYRNTACIPLLALTFLTPRPQCQKKNMQTSDPLGSTKQERHFLDCKYTSTLLHQKRIILRMCI